MCVAHNACTTFRGIVDADYRAGERVAYSGLNAAGLALSNE